MRLFSQRHLLLLQRRGRRRLFTLDRNSISCDIRHSAQNNCYLNYKKFSKNGSSEKLSTLVLLRHGQSTWNATPTFTGWCDVPLTNQGILEAKAAGRLLRNRGYTHFDVAFTSTLQRAIVTCELAVQGAVAVDRNTAQECSDEDDNNGDFHATTTAAITNFPSIIKAWQLNERHYGSLQGLKKNDAGLIRKYGEAQLKKWRRDFYAIPPQMDEHHKYYEPPPTPLSESLQLCQDRVLKYWDDVIYPTLMKKPGMTVLLAAHSNSLRALVTYLDDVPLENVPSIHIPNSVPCVYQFDIATGEIVAPALLHITSSSPTSTAAADAVIDRKGSKGGASSNCSRGQWLFSAENYKRLHEKLGGENSSAFIQAMFHAWDVNNDGVLSLEEIEMGLKEIMGSKDIAIAAVAGKIFEEIDRDGSKTLDMEEFEASAMNACKKFLPGLF